VIVDAASGASGKVRQRAGDSQGISQVWFADGERLEGGRALDQNQASKLERARVMISPSETGVITDEYYEESKRPWGTWGAIGAAGAAVLIGAIALAWPSSEPPRKKPAPVAAAVAAAATIDAGVATPPEPAPAISVDAAVAPQPLVTPPAPAKAISIEKAPEKPAPKTVVDKPAARAADKPAAPARRDLIIPGMSSTATADKPADTTASENTRKAEFFARLGDQALRAGDYVAAAGNYKSSLELDATNVEATSGLGEIALQQGMYGDAVAHLRKAARMAPKSARIQTLLGEAYLNSANASAAAAAFKKALQIDPDSARARDGYNDAAGRLPVPQDEP
jgi:hypothetical protein